MSLYWKNQTAGQRQPEMALGEKMPEAYTNLQPRARHPLPALVPSLSDSRAGVLGRELVHTCAGGQKRQLGRHMVSPTSGSESCFSLGCQRSRKEAKK